MLVWLDLVVEDATDLINFDDRRSSVVMNDAILPVVVKHTLLLKISVSGVLLVVRKRVLVSNGNVRVDDSISS